MGEARAEYEGEVFRRLESRLVAVEIKSEGNAVRIGKLEPVVGELRDKDMLASAIAERVREGGRDLVSRVTIMCAVAALVVPPIITALLVKWMS